VAFFLMQKNIFMDDLQKAAEELTAKNKKIDDKAKTFIVDLIKGQRSPEFIVEKLVANGYDYQQSYDATHELYDRVIITRDDIDKKGSTTDILIGLAILAVGITITASGNVIAYGAIIVGAIKLIRGIANSMS
jgi:hypothetical protein